jgi:hypothetical protein
MECTLNNCNVYGLVANRNTLSIALPIKKEAPSPLTHEENTSFVFILYHSREHLSQTMTLPVWLSTF